MNVTTIKLTNKTKFQLSKLKDKSESYEDVLQRLIIHEKSLKQRLIEGYKNENLNEFEEWESSSKEVDERND